MLIVIVVQLGKNKSYVLSKPIANGKPRLAWPEPGASGRARRREETREAGHSGLGEEI